MSVPTHGQHAHVATVSAAANFAAARGKALAQQFGCASCHSFDGTPSIGPTWKGLYGSTETAMDGKKVVADANFIRKFILDPDFVVFPGRPVGVMPRDFRKKLSDKQIDDIIAFIKSLSTK